MRHTQSNPFSAGGRYPSGMGGMSRWSVNTWIIVINIAVFVLDAIMAGRGGIGPLFVFGFFSTEKALSDYQVWRFVTFQFLHGGFWHIFMNMLALYWFGPQVEQYLGSRRFLAFYLLCGCAGAAFYLLLNLGGNMFGDIPPFLPADPRIPLVGASAGVFGVLLAMAYLRPNDVITLLLFFIIPLSMRIRTLAYGLVVLALFIVYTGGNNAGGEAGHLGGAMLGAFLIRFPGLLNWALMMPVEKMKSRGKHAFDRYGGAEYASGARRPQSRGSRKPSSPLGDSQWFQGRKQQREQSHASQAEIDRILSKIALEGIGSLTAKERETLEADTERLRDEGADYR